MKRITLIIFVLFLFNISFSQIIINKRQSFLKRIELTKLDTVDADFIHVHIHNRLLNLKMTCSVDYGQKRKYCYKKSKIRQENGKKKKFNSEADVINYISDNGWDYLEYDTFAFVFKRN